MVSVRNKKNYPAFIIKYCMKSSDKYSPLLIISNTDISKVPSYIKEFSVDAFAIFT